MSNHATGTAARAVSDTGLLGLLAEYKPLRDMIRDKVRSRFPINRRVLVPRQYGGTGGVVDGYHGSEVDAVWVRLDVPDGAEMRRALVLAADLLNANWEG